MTNSRSNVKKSDSLLRVFSINAQESLYVFQILMLLIQKRLTQLLFCQSSFVFCGILQLKYIFTTQSHFSYRSIDVFGKKKHMVLNKWRKFLIEQTLCFHYFYSEALIKAKLF